MDAASRQRAAAALRRHAPGLAGTELAALGQGLDHTAHLAGDLVLRVGGDVAREAGLLRLVAARVPLPVPEPVFADEDDGVLAYRLLPGRPLLGRDAGSGQGAVLARFLRALHAIDPREVSGLVPVEEDDPGEWLADLAGPPELLAVLRATVPPPAAHRVLAHADLGAEHLLARDGVLTGVIDWSDAAVTDPALDLARPYRDFGPAFLAEVLDAYGDGAPDLDRIRFFARCAALEDLEFGLRTGQAAYTRAARRSLTWLFPSS
ncbi:phosphotransferase [Modestobacter altitudinis]|uniref:phosphotransferase n=1 Tax=Modestobacter altitudinis TaxID=2213158 RepID=UPI001C55323A|nr:phosphotransferase [Modestobacter altitudinis]